MPNAIPLLALTSLIYGVQYLDQILMGLFAQPIKSEFGLSDTQLGLLTGAAFTLFYVFMGFPLARLADRRNRKWIITGSVLLFSAATVACGLAVGFASLFVARVAIAIGEAGTMPAATSLLAARFKGEHRRLAMALHSSGGYLGTAASLLIVGLVSNHFGWRAIFWGAGAGGIGLAAAVALFVKEPARDAQGGRRHFWADLRLLLRSPTFVFVVLAQGVSSIGTSSAINWFPAFLERSHHLPHATVVLMMAGVWTFGAIPGSVASGFLTSKLSRRGGRWPLVALGIFKAIVPIAFIAAFHGSTLPAAIAGMIVAMFFMGSVRGPATAAIQEIAPLRCQATASAIMMFSMYALGVTVGPLLTGAISDALRVSEGEESLRFGLLIVIPTVGTLSALLFFLAAWKENGSLPDDEARHS